MMCWRAESPEVLLDIHALTQVVDEVSPTLLGLLDGTGEDSDEQAPSWLSSSEGNYCAEAFFLRLR
jgi:hypothetical protein